MILPSELEALEQDLDSLSEAVFLLRKNNPDGLPDKIFNHRVVSRCREILEVANNIERASFNRQFSVMK